MIAISLAVGFALILILIVVTILGAAAAHHPGPCFDCRDGKHTACDGCGCPVDHSESTVEL